MSAPRVCAVVVTYNRAELLAKCLDGLNAQARPAEEIVVVDNASTDSTPDLLAGHYPNLAHHRLARNLGASGGFYEGAKWAHQRGFDWVWLLDDDVVPEQGCLGELLLVADASGRGVVVPRRRTPTGAYPCNEAIIDEAGQQYYAPESQDRWVPIDVFTFEGPMFHRSVIDAVGYPNPRFFIIADDTEYSVRIYQALGPLAAVLANQTAVDRLLSTEDDVRGESMWKNLITGDATFPLKPDEQHWKHGYYMRNRHLVWKLLGWRKRRFRQIVIHAGYVLTDCIEARRRRWDWWLRMKVNVRALVLGVLGKDGAFIDPAAYHEERSRRARSRA